MTVFTVIRDDNVDLLEEAINQLGDVNYLVKETPTNELFCKSAPLISVAAYFGSIKCFKYLVQHDANINMKDQKGRLPVHYAAAGPSLDICDELDDLDVDFTALDDEKNSVIHYAAQFGRIKFIQRFELRGFDLAIQNIEGKQPIHIACEKQYVNILEHLIDHGVPIDTPTLNGTTPLFIVLEKRNLRMLQILVEHKVNTAVKMKDEMTPLMIAARNDHYQIANTLLMNPEEDVNMRDPLGWTALHYAAEIGSEQICRLLIGRGADVNMTTNEGMTPLHLAQNRQRLQTATFLEYAGGKTWV